MTRKIRADVALRDAAATGRIDAVRELLRRGARPDSECTNSRTPLYCAAISGRADIVLALLDAGASPDFGRTPLCTREEMRAHEANEPSDYPYGYMDSGATPLIAAVSFGTCGPGNARFHGGSPEIVEALLEYGADPNLCSLHYGKTALMQAAQIGAGDLARLLIAHGADVNAVSRYWGTPLSLACWGDHEALVRLLLGAGADPELEHPAAVHAELRSAAVAVLKWKYQCRDVAQNAAIRGMVFEATQRWRTSAPSARKP